MKKLILTFLICLISLIFTSPAQALRKIDAGGVNLPEGYKIEAVVANLSVPTTAIFDGENLIIAESGTANTAKPRILKVSPDGKWESLVEEGLNPPVTGLLVIDGKLYISHKTKVSILENGKLKDIVTGLPSLGDHQNNKIVLGPDGKIYLGQGTVTNSGVVGVDNYLFGWLKENPKAHDVACKDITLVGQNFKSDNPLSRGQTLTGAYHAFGEPSKEGEVIKGESKCNGSILRFNKDGSNLEMYAWGMRNPFGVAFDQNGKLWTNFHGADVRGSRPIFNDTDYLIKVEKNGWYGWPEYFNGKPVTDPSFDSPDGPKPQFLWQDHPHLSQQFAIYEPHAAANGLAFSPGGEFGYKGQGFSALFGTFTTPTAGINITPAGFSVARVDMQTGEVTTFASNKIAGPSYINQTGGFNRPSDIVFGSDSSMYVVDFGGSKLTNKGLELTPQTGVVWRIYKDSQKAVAPNGPILVDAAPISPKERVPLVMLNWQLIKSQLPHVATLLLPVIIVVSIFAFILKKKPQKKKTTPKK